MLKLETNEIRIGVLKNNDKFPLYFDGIKIKYDKDILNLYVGTFFNLLKLLTTYLEKYPDNRDNIDIENMIMVFNIYNGFIKVNKNDKGQFELILKIDSTKFVTKHSMKMLGYLEPIDFYKKVIETFIDIVNSRYLPSNRSFTEIDSNQLVECI